MMIFNQKQQIATKRNHSYVAKQFGCLWVKRAIFTQQTYIELGSL